VIGQLGVFVLVRDADDVVRVLLILVEGVVPDKAAIVIDFAIVNDAVE
jgi:hypothetical protein